MEYDKLFLRMELITCSGVLKELGDPAPSFTSHSFVDPLDVGVFMELSGRC